MHEYSNKYLVKTAKIQVESNIIKWISTTNTEHNILLTMMLWGSVEFSNWTPCQTLLQIIPHSFPIWSFLCYSIYADKSLVLGTHRHTERQRQGQIHKTTFRQERIQTHTKDRGRWNTYGEQSKELKLSTLVSFVNGTPHYWWLRVSY